MIVVGKVAPVGMPHLAGEAPVWVLPTLLWAVLQHPTGPRPLTPCYYYYRYYYCY